MDIVTQGLAGAVLAQSAGRRQTLRWAGAAGLVAGLAPDLDILIRSADDPLLQLDYHRHFSHALLTAPLGGALVATLFRLLPRAPSFLPSAGSTRSAPPSWGVLWFAATLGWLSAGLLDACTSYGTHLFWPFGEQRVAWNLIAIVDPLFSLVLLAGAVHAWRRRRPAAARAALLLALCYLGFGALQRERAAARVDELAAARGHDVAARVVKPTLANLLVWRSVYRAGDTFHVDALRLGLQTRHYPGGAVAAFDLARDFPTLAARPDGVLSHDVARFARLSGGFLVRHPTRPGVVGDLRYALLADSIEPLWGIGVDPARADRHAPLLQFRETGDAERRRFVALLLGNAE